MSWNGNKTKVIGCLIEAVKPETVHHRAKGKYQNSQGDRDLDAEGYEERLLEAFCATGGCSIGEEVANDSEHKVEGLGGKEEDGDSDWYADSPDVEFEGEEVGIGDDGGGQAGKLLESVSTLKKGIQLSKSISM